MPDRPTAKDPHIPDGGVPAAGAIRISDQRLWQTRAGFLFNQAFVPSSCGADLEGLPSPPFPNPGESKCHTVRQCVERVVPCSRDQGLAQLVMRQGRNHCPNLSLRPPARSSNLAALLLPTSLRSVSIHCAALLERDGKDIKKHPSPGVSANSHH